MRFYLRFCDGTQTAAGHDADRFLTQTLVRAQLPPDSAKKALRFFICDSKVCGLFRISSEVGILFQVHAELCTSDKRAKVR